MATTGVRVLCTITEDDEGRTVLLFEYWSGGRLVGASVGGQAR